MARARIKFLTPKAKILAQVAKPRGQERPWLTTLVLGQTGSFSKLLNVQEWFLYLQIHQLMGQLSTLGDQPLSPCSHQTSNRELY